MNKKLIAIPATAIALTMLLSGCTNASEPTPKPPTSEEKPNPDKPKEDGGDEKPSEGDKKPGDIEIKGAPTASYLTNEASWAYYADAGAKLPSEDMSPRSLTWPEMKAISDSGNAFESTEWRTAFGEMFADVEATAVNISKMEGWLFFKDISEVPADKIVNRYPNIITNIRLTVADDGWITVIASNDDDSFMVNAGINDPQE